MKKPSNYFCVKIQNKICAILQLNFLKMKKRIIIFLVLFFPILNNFGNNVPIAAGRLDDEIPAKGNNSTVYAYLTDDSIEIEFLKEYSNITITIEDSIGTVVFNNTINTTVGMIYSIDVSNLGTGWYNIRIESKTGGIKGCFYLE